MAYIEIGSKYEGPSWDKPCLRQMPREWILEETRQMPTYWHRWILALIVLMLMLSCAQMVKGLA